MRYCSEWAWCCGAAALDFAFRSVLAAVASSHSVPAPRLIGGDAPAVVVTRPVRPCTSPTTCDRPSSRGAVDLRAAHASGCSDGSREGLLFRMKNRPQPDQTVALTVIGRTVAVVSFPTVCFSHCAMPRASWCACSSEPWRSAVAKEPRLQRHFCGAARPDRHCRRAGRSGHGFVSAVLQHFYAPSAGHRPPIPAVTLSQVSSTGSRALASRLCPCVMAAAGSLMTSTCKPIRDNLVAALRV